MLIDTPTSYREQKGALPAWTRCLVLAFLLLFLTGCPPTSQTIRVESEPDHARVSVGGVDMGTTPLGVRVHPGTELPAIRVEKGGYEPAEVRLSEHLDPWFIPRDIGMGGLFYAVWFGLGAFIPDKSWWDADILRAAGGVALLVTASYMIYELSVGSAYRVRPSSVNVKLREKQ